MNRAGWRRLWRHSYRLGWGWLLRGFRHRWRGARVGLCRLLVPLDPWRYYELGRVAEQEFAGPCLDVSSPKLLASLLQHEQRGRWLGVDLFRTEVENWRWVDPSLSLEVQDARALACADSSFDHAICISVVEHIAGDGDGRAMAELWRVLRPGGVLHLTTNVSSQSRELHHRRGLWGDASERTADGGVFFERHYSPSDIERRLLVQAWEITEREYAMQVDPGIEERFYQRSPWSYLWGGMLRFWCARNFVTSSDPACLLPDRHGVVYLRLRKPAAGTGVPPPVDIEPRLDPELH